jgi:hypothetical protein
MSFTVPSLKTVDPPLPDNGFGVPENILRRERRRRIPTDCLSTVTETMGKKLVRTRV